MVLLPLALSVFLALPINADAEAAASSISAVSPAETVSDVSLARLRHDAVQNARLGQYQSAIDTLSALSERYPNDAETLHDLLIVLGWAERDQEALDSAERLTIDRAPSTVLNSLGKSARNVRDFEKAVQWYELAVSRLGASVDSHIGLAMALADIGRPEKAMHALQVAAVDDRHHSEVLMTEAYIFRSDRRYPQAITAYEKVLTINPEHRGALRGKTLTLQRLLLPHQALSLASQHPGILSEDEFAQIHADRIAVQIRWVGQTATDDTAGEFSLSPVLRELSEIQHRYADNDPVQRRLRFDRIVALRNLQRMDEVVSEYEQLDAEDDSVPAYVLGNAAAAYSFLKQPEKAEVLLRKALQQEPGSFSLNRDLFYVYVDQEEHERAMILAEEMRQGQPVWHQEPGSRVAKTNTQRMQAEIMAGLSLAFADQLSGSQARFEDLLSRAPHNTDLRHELGSVYRNRGWTDRALFQYRQVLAVEPELIPARVGLAHTMLDSRHYKVAEHEINELVAEQPARQDVLRLSKRWQNENKYQYRIDSLFGDSSGDQFGSRQYEINAYFAAKPLAYRWRPFVRTHDTFAEFPEGDSERRRVGAGLDYRAVNWAGSIELSNDRSGGEAGLHGRVEWRISDLWSLGGLWETNSDAVPLRGHRIGVDADRIGANLTYRASEQRQIRLSGEQSDLSDGNTRNSWLLTGRQRLVTRPAYKLDLTAEAFASDSSAQNAVYFNPNSDSSVTVTAINEWRTYRRFDFSFTQQLNIAVGYYRQDSFGTGSIGSLQYLANVNVVDGLSARFSVRYARNVYDGLAEYGTFFTLGIAGSF